MSSRRSLNTHPQVLCDTSWFVALFDPQDTLHDSAVNLHEDNKRERRELITHWGILGETLTLLRKRASFRSVQAFSSSLASYTIVEIPSAEALQIVGLFGRLTKDKFISFVDVVTYHLATSRFDSVPVLTFDRDFKQLGLHTLPALR